MPARRYPSSIPTAVVAWGAESWATDDDAVDAVRAIQLTDVVIAPQCSLAFFYELGVLKEGYPLIVISPSMFSLDEPFVDMIEQEANIVYDIRDNFAPAHVSDDDDDDDDDSADNADSSNSVVPASSSSSSDGDGGDDGSNGEPANLPGLTYVTDSTDWTYTGGLDIP